MTILDEALRYAELGWRVLPLKPNSRKPAMNSWQHYATADPAKIRKGFNGQYKDSGLGVATGPDSGIWVLDVDNKDGKNGSGSLHALIEANGDVWAHGPITHTPSGGFHYFFRQPADLVVKTTKNLQDSASGLDVRGGGGQVVVAPTVIDGRPYAWITDPWDVEPPDAPDWLLDLVCPDRAAPPTAQAELWTPTPDTGGMVSAADEIEAALDWHQILSGDGWAIESTDAKGDTNWTRPGKETKAGMSAVLHEPNGPFVVFTTSVPALCQSWAHNSSSDCWVYTLFQYYAATRFHGDRSEAARDWAQRRQSRQLSEWATEGSSWTVPGPGGTSTAPGASHVSEGHGEPKEDPLAWANVVDWGEFWTKDHSKREWVAWPLVPKGRGVALFAEAKAGKSTITLAIVAAAAAGRSILGRHTPERPRHVVYLDYEMTEDDLFERLEELGYGPDDEVLHRHLHYSLLPAAFPLDTFEGAAQICALAKHYEAELVVIDTFSRAVQGDEQDNATAQNYYRFTGKTLKAHGVAALRLDHAGKDLDRGQRGGSAKNDDVDLVWQLSRTDLGVKIERTHSRITWAQGQIDIQQEQNDDGSVEYRIVDRNDYPPGTRELAKLMDDLGIARDASGRAAAAQLRAAGEGAKNDRIRAAQAYRATLIDPSWLDPVAVGNLDVDQHRTDPGVALDRGDPLHQATVAMGGDAFLQDHGGSPGRDVDEVRDFGAEGVTVRADVETGLHPGGAVFLAGQHVDGVEADALLAGDQVAGLADDPSEQVDGVGGDGVVAHGSIKTQAGDAVKISDECTGCQHNGTFRDQVGVPHPCRLDPGCRPVAKKANLF